MERNLTITSARHLRRYEKINQQLMRQSANRFKLAGSLRALVSDEELVDIVVRAERSDRLIAATAACLECPLRTRDSEIQGLAGVEVIW